MRNKSECKSGEGKYLLDLSADKKVCKIRGKPFHLHYVCSTLSFALGVTLTRPFICIWTKRNLKYFHYLKRAISQLKRMFLLTAINLGQPPLCSQAIALLSHSTKQGPQPQSPAACNHHGTLGSHYWGCFHRCHFVGLCVCVCVCVCLCVSVCVCLCVCP